MKPSDLVQFKKAFRGLGNLVGTIIAENGKGFDILWSVPIDPPFGQASAARIQTELPEFVEVCNETR